MKNLKKLVIGIALVSLPVYMAGCAAVAPEPQAKASVIGKTLETGSKSPGKTKVIARPGDTIHLFHGANKLAKEEFCLNEVVPVSRYFGNRYKNLAEVGKVKITEYVGDHYLEGVVVEGTIKDGDVAMKPNSACLIRLPQPEEKEEK